MKTTSRPGPLTKNYPKIKPFALIAIICAMTFLAFLSAGSQSEPPQDSDWTKWSKKETHKILYDSPWVQNCCRTVLSGGGPSDLGLSAAIVSSLVLRQALLRRMDLDQKYEALDLAKREELDRTAAACLDLKFDDRIVVSLSFNAESALAGMKTIMTEHHLPEYQAAPAYLVTSDGKIVLPLPARSGGSVEETCGVTKDLDRTVSGEGPWEGPWALYGPKHEVSFPRYVEGHPTIKLDDKILRIKLGGVFGMGSMGEFNIKPEFDFKLDQMIYRGKPDF